MQDAYVTLVCEIFAQARKDYAVLKQKGISYQEGRPGFSIKEIEEFLTGEWAKNLLDGINCCIKGRDIIRRMKEEIRSKEEECEI